MKRLYAFALIATVAFWGCSKVGDPAGPEPTPINPNLIAAFQCGEVEYASMLSGTLPVWRDSIETNLEGPGLDDAPVFDGENLNAYLIGLSATLRQWDAAITAALDTTILDSIPAFDGSLANQYLGVLSDRLAQWETALETFVGLDFLPTLDTFTSDTTPPTLFCAADTLIECADSAGAMVEFVVVAMDDCDPAPVVECDPPSGSVFPVGETVVTCTATDSLGNSSACSFTVTVATDTTPPTVTGVTVTDEYLWPPNHKMWEVGVSADVEDDCSGVIACYIYDVTSNEPANGKGDGNTEPDWEITDDLMVNLRAERSGKGGGRVYTLHIRCEDASGNTSETTAEVHVAHDQGGE